MLGISDRERFVITVAASPDQNPASIADAVNTKIQGTQGLWAHPRTGHTSPNIGTRGDFTGGLPPCDS